MIPRIAIIDQNTLESMGLKSIISDIVPMADVSTFSSFEGMMQEKAMSDESIPFWPSSGRYRKSWGTAV